MTDVTITISLDELRALQKLAGAAKAAANNTAQKYNSRGARTCAEYAAEMVRTLRAWAERADGADAVAAPAAPGEPSSMSPDDAVAATEAMMLERQRAYRAGLTATRTQPPAARRRDDELPPHMRVAKFEDDEPVI